MPKVSIIVPIHNAERTLGWCINSVLNQTFRDIEVLLVNDGSTDHSSSICQNYAMLDKRVKVLEQSNQGVSCARNYGLQCACGEYIQFVDSDDVIKSNMTETLLRTIEGYEKDSVVCPYYRITKSEKNEYSAIKQGVSGLYSERVFDHDSLWKNMMRLIWEYAAIEVPWNKLYKRNIIIKNRLQFSPSFSLGEDFLFNLDYFQHCNGAIFISTPLYYYIAEQTDSLTGRKRPDILQTIIDLEIALKQHIEAHHTISGLEMKLLLMHLSSRICDSFYHVCRSCSNLQQAKMQIAKAIQTPFVQQAFSSSAYLSEKTLPFSKAIQEYDVGSICHKCISAHSSAKIVSHLQPGKLNRAFVKFMQFLQRFPFLRIKKWAHIVELNLTTVGLKATWTRIKHKLFHEAWEKNI